MQKLDSMLNGMKSEMEALVDRMPCATPLEKLEMKNRIHNATIVPAQSSFNLRSESSACCMRNDDGSHSIHFPPAYLAQLSGGNAKLVEQVMAHELAHAMDGQEPNRTEKYKRACPVLGEGLAQCIGNKYNLGNYPKATDSLFTESFADNMANELINARVKSTDAEKRITPQEVARRACMLNATAGGATTYTGDSHPNGTDRATQLLAGPDVRKALGCPKCAPFATAKTCGVTK